MTRTLRLRLAKAFGAVCLVVWLPAIYLSCSVNAHEDLRDTHFTDLREFRFVERHLNQPFEGYGALDTFVIQFRAIALSNMACGLMNIYTADPEQRPRLLPLAEELVTRVRSENVSPMHSRLDLSMLRDDHNLYFSHAALTMGIERYIRCGPACTERTEQDVIQEALVNHLRARSLATPLFHARSYPDSTRWPADQTVTLLAIKMYDATHGTHLVDRPLAGFLAVMREHTDARTGLFHSAVTPISYGNTPRGCAISWSTMYLAQLAPDVATAQYAAYKAHMSEDVLGFGGFREWPRDRPMPMDGDSGPIVMGVGVAATGFGLGAARILGDEERYSVIRHTSLFFGMPSWIPSHGYNMSPLLGEAILFNGRTARRWFN